PRRLFQPRRLPTCASSFRRTSRNKLKLRAGVPAAGLAPEPPSGICRRCVAGLRCSFGRQRLPEPLNHHARSPEQNSVPRRPRVPLQTAAIFKRGGRRARPLILPVKRNNRNRCDVPLSTRAADAESTRSFNLKI